MSPADAQVLRALPPGQRDKFEAFIHRQARSDARFREHTDSLEPEVLDRKAEGMQARSWFGTGGGRYHGHEPHGF